MMLTTSRRVLVGATAAGILFAAGCDGEPVIGEAAAVTVPCLHKPGSRKTCPDTTFMLDGIPIGEVAAIELRLVTTGGDTVTRSYRTDDVDALFLTWPAIQTFVIPYYRAREGADSAAAIERRYERLRR